MNFKYFNFIDSSYYQTLSELDQNILLSEKGLFVQRVKLDMNLFKDFEQLGVLKGYSEAIGNSTI